MVCLTDEDCSDGSEYEGNRAAASSESGGRVTGLAGGSTGGGFLVACTGSLGGSAACSWGGVTHSGIADHGCHVASADWVGGGEDGGASVDRSGGSDGSRVAC